jgi:hypothetical protein
VGEAGEALVALEDVQAPVAHAQLHLTRRQHQYESKKMDVSLVRSIRHSRAEGGGGGAPGGLGGGALAGDEDAGGTGGGGGALYAEGVVRFGILGGLARFVGFAINEIATELENDRSRLPLQVHAYPCEEVPIDCESQTHHRVDE